MPDAAPTRPGSQFRGKGLSAGDRPFDRALLFTGHMIDRPDRASPRFPATAESRVRAAIREAVRGFLRAGPGTTIGVAAAASGGDMLFHEICAELGIRSVVMLALPADEFVAASVAPAGPMWVKRFRTLLERAGAEGTRVMADNDGLAEGATNNVWQRANLWMMDAAMALARQQALLALWDGHRGDGPGGTEHFIEVAQKSGIGILPILAMQDLLPNKQREK